jgi:hypothetical protein
MKQLNETEQPTTRNRRPWESPELKSVGTIGAVLQGGGGKLSPVAADTGDIRKPKGQG